MIFLLCLCFNTIRISFYSDTHDFQRLNNLIHHDNQYDLDSHCGNLATTEEVSVEGQRSLQGYNEVMLAWVKDWDTETRDFIKLDILLYKPGIGSCYRLKHKSIDLILSKIFDYQIKSILEIICQNNDFLQTKTSFIVVKPPP